MAKLDTLTLRVSNPDAQRRFYCNAMGMSDQGGGRIGYSSRETALMFSPAQKTYRPRSSDLYWKIAISVPNIELACAQLTSKGICVTEPRQFRDIGFLAKVTDPEGFTVELIDHWFQGERPEEPCDHSLLGGGPHLSLVTLRTADIAAVEPDILIWGMTPLSIQPVVSHGFTLYFYAFTEERPPNPDLMAVENRSWVYRRPYSVLEIQHVHALDTECHPEQDAAGYESIAIQTGDVPIDFDRLRIRTSSATS